MKLRSMLLCVVLFSAYAWAYAQEEKRPEAIGIEEKLERLYELYRVGETVSLKRRQMRFGLGVAYAFDEVSQLGARASARALTLDGSFAYGITDWLETGISLPFSWSQLRVETADATLARSDIGGVGDMGIRFIAALPVSAFEVVGIWGLAFPTGRRGLGQSGIRSSLGVNVAVTSRPAFLFGGLSWEHNVATHVNGVTYTGGVGFYLNHQLSLGLEVTGTRFLNPPRGGAYDVVAASVQASYQLTPFLGITPQVSVGLTDSAPDVVVGVNMIWRP